MLSKYKRVITVASNAELMNKHYYRRLWLSARNLDIPRRKWLDLVADAFLLDDFYLIQPNGEPYRIPLVDDVFGDDVDMRWMGYYLRPGKDGQNPEIYSRKLERLRLIDLYFRICKPKMAAHFGR